ncbi:unnamed protein product [Oikopleura dioica]|uniref:Uncharacterized protein n=1 Tax=Oikopleura dioica TaxID=34765 RepID=E4Y884_OIKDI|nr:unnamed protein product [Oikopleura dioica]
MIILKQLRFICAAGQIKQYSKTSYANQLFCLVFSTKQKICDFLPRSQNKNNRFSPVFRSAQSVKNPTLTELIKVGCTSKNVSIDWPDSRLVRGLKLVSTPCADRPSLKTNFRKIHRTVFEKGRSKKLTENFL